MVILNFDVSSLLVILTTLLFHGHCYTKMSVRLSPDRKWNECCNQIIRHIALCRREHILELNVKFGTPPSPFECPFGGCGKRFSSQSELISHMDKESAEAREKQQLQVDGY